MILIKIIHFVGMKKILIANLTSMKQNFDQNFVHKFSSVKSVFVYVCFNYFHFQKNIDRFKTETMDTIIRVEEFDDVKRLGEEIFSYQDQVQELSIFCFHNN